MATKTIVSGENGTPVGKPGTKLFTRTRSTYTLDENGKIDPNSVKQEILYSQVPGDPPVIAATRNGTTGDFTLNKNEFTGKFYFGADAQKSLKEGALKTTTNQQIETSAKKEGLTPEQQKSLTNNRNVASAGVGTTSSALDTFKEELDRGFNKTTREKYQDVKYPLNLKLENQDCIKFSIAEYKAPGVKPGSSDAGSRIVTLSNSKPKLGTGKDRKIIATITLPIPAGINDRNPADWSSNELGELQRAFTNISISAITGGGSAAASATGSEGSNASRDLKSVEAGIVSKFAELATGATNILSRQYGAAVNPNMELLFNGPSLRSFTFNFRFTPRESKEAEAVRKIIRQFKQAMSVKRSKSSLLLRAPHTFAISYLSNNKDHPYLNRFKECALTECAVNYTPDGTYMTYGDSSMTAYELSLTFQELEPIFDDEYFEIDENKDTSIGF